MHVDAVGVLRAGMEVDAVVSFDGVLQSDPVPFPGGDTDFDSSVAAAPNTYSNSRIKVLVENGHADTNVTPTSRAAWADEVDANGVDWVWHEHARTTARLCAVARLCTKYTEHADRRSAQSMWSLSR